MTQLIFNIAGRSDGVSDLLSQQRLIAVPKSMKRLPDGILSHA
jgi:hypothetical protein